MQKRIHPLPQMGQIYGRWTVVGQWYRKKSNVMVPCQCRCGTIKDVYHLNLVKGKSISCGCFRKENPTGVVHGETRTRLHTIWLGIRQRCNNPRASLYKYYGARGISVCDQWQLSYVAFRDWARSHGYSDTLVIDRIDTYGDYMPSNCRWVTQKENMRNARNNHLLTAFGETKCLAEWAEDSRCKVRYGTLWKRLKDGWPAESALTKPLQRSVLRPADIPSIRQRLAKGESCASISRDFSVNRSAISSIKHGKTWASSTH